ncbi:endonuclease NucS domain-containing protein [Agilicoccus flavus]|uniref:endonuclease NucS domain-containing protein n=1 Tax=Agilicoccus flavus TaxID=2775968 RepID=UPI001CF63F11|nr:endonuclease NucS domain-containing protein [Agilicoccus flavus]
MPVEMGLWRIDGGTPRRLAARVLPSEADLENFLAQDPSLLGERLLVIGQQVRTPHGKYIDLLAIDSEGRLHVLELKRDKTPREVVAQILDYGSWVTDLDRDSILAIANEHLTLPFETAFEEVFESSPPDELNVELRLTVVATDLDGSSERIVAYLRNFGVPINAVFFSFLEDNERRYLARSWLVTAEEGSTGSSSQSRKKGKRAEWNGKDWYVSFGDHEGGRAWVDGRRFGFVSAGGGRWYSRTLRELPVGARVWVCIPGSGYVAVGETLERARPFREARVRIDGAWAPLAEQELRGNYRKNDDGDDTIEYAVPVRWHEAVPVGQAYWEKGFFANQNSACKLRQEFTLDRLSQHFRVNED